MKIIKKITNYRLWPFISELISIMLGIALTLAFAISPFFVLYKLSAKKNILMVDYMVLAVVTISVIYILKKMIPVYFYLATRLRDKYMYYKQLQRRQYR